eukprot:SAG11_NODE_4289_length_1967_cov_1.743576_2_plen_97_part_00
MSESDSESFSVSFTDTEGDESTLKLGAPRISPRNGSPAGAPRLEWLARGRAFERDVHHLTWAMNAGHEAIAAPQNYALTSRRACAFDVSELAVTSP